MKNIKSFIAQVLGVVTALAFFTACENDDHVPEFTLQAASENVAFQNTFLAEYLLSTETANNIAERFVWNQVDFGVQTQISYQLEGSISENFDAEPDYQYDSGTLSETNASVTIKNLLAMAAGLGLDDDPATTDGDGNPNNTGTVYFKVTAFVGSGEGTDAVSTTSDVEQLTITLVEKSDEGGSGIQISSWGVVGSGYNDWGAFEDAPFYTTGTDGVYVAYVNLLDGEIKFRENNDWTNNFGDTGADGTLDAGGDNIVVTAGDYKITMDLNDSTYAIEAYSWGVVGSGYNDWGGAGPDAKFFYDYTTDTFKVGVKLIDGEIKFRLNNDWGTNYGDSGADGTLDNGGDNIAVTAGFYAITLDFNTGTYTMEEASIWGVVGSGYNDWGATPDFLFTEVNPGIWIAENVELIDGEIKFRINEDWTVNYGDTGVDGTLDDGGDNIVVTAGTYIITLNLTEGETPTYSLDAR
ncbi:SusE domain-containing protein [Flagellimonas pelagia]|uniref:SusF/SusE family outer membrane protein n=1 Tax=Flagellimonas pelagia TaxID=2306998 RepID=A0A3A1NIJ4_9FLAO|nr:SusF/SusE family outer membrane protein [Allomuricauda maritima]RIV45406.1 SusF/SusE family outer membrane protein [Allomuricauda maritima]TXJ96883.1 SusF/SusE family outer membrane protein [Allomuricauda maritima]